MKNEIDILRDISERFVSAGIPFMVTGSIAMNYYAQPRMTRDIDVVIAVELKDIDSIIRIFSPDYYVARDAVSSSIAHESMFNLIHLESIIKIDCIVRKRSRYRLLEFERRQKIVIADFPTTIASKEDLIISKLSWAKDSHSEVQLRDVKNLLATGYDATYLDQWTRDLGLGNLLKECLHEGHA